MFDFLKKKISGLVEKITGRAKEKAPEAPKEAIKPKEKPGMPGVREEPPAGKLAKKKVEKPSPKPAPKEEPEKIVQEVPKPAPKAEKKAEPSRPGEIKAEKKDEKIKLGLVTQIKSIFSNEVELGEREVGAALDDFEMELLETDVAFEVAEQIKDELRQNLVGRKVRKSELQEHISSVFFNSIKEIMSENRGKTILEIMKENEDNEENGARPLKIMFTGPNGSGKTTTIAKVAKMLKENGYSVVIAAADTFRAAAIEQMEIHGNRLGIKVVKGKYGADPTSVAFDAVNHAKAHGIDAVLIDTAGRQETNRNLLNELKKMARVINPELKIYVGESIAGNAIIEQVDTFNKELKLDGVILTKLDCDAKGGTVISISKVTKVPVLYVTTGQGYGDIEVFEPDKIARNIAG